MVELTDLIEIHDDTIQPEICDYLIDFFEKSPDKHTQGDGNFVEVNLTNNKDLTTELNTIHNIFIQKTFEYKKQYYEFVDSRVFPEQHAFEYFKVRRYNPNDFVDAHVDVMNHESSRRFLCFYWFLNDIESGGEVQFRDLIVSPKKTRLLLFPPMWLFPYKENASISNPKYVVSTYLHYK